MTDGIIQEVFQEVFENYMINHNVKPSFLNGLMKELIVAIKQHCKKRNNANFVMLDKLIGDNQE